MAKQHQKTQLKSAKQIIRRSASISAIIMKYQSRNLCFFFFSSFFFFPFLFFCTSYITLLHFSLNFFYITLSLHLCTPLRIFCELTFASDEGRKCQQSMKSMAKSNSKARKSESVLEKVSRSERAAYEMAWRKNYQRSGGARYEANEESESGESSRHGGRQRLKKHLAKMKQRK